MGLFNNEKVDVKNLNKIILLGAKIMKILVVVLSIVGLYAITLIFKEWKILNFLLVLLKILSPFFIGLVIAWLLAPFVEFLHKNGVNKVLGTIITYVLMLGILFLIVTTLFPLLLNQINDFIYSLPKIVNSITDLLNKGAERFSGVSFLDINAIKQGISDSFQSFVKTISTDTPAAILTFVKGFAGTLTTFVVGLMIGFYLLFDFNNISKVLLSLVPRKIKSDVSGLFKEANVFLFDYVKGTLLVSLLIFVLSTISFMIAGLKAPLLFGLICGITNIIPYVGPYLGGIPAVIVGFSQGAPTGIIVLVAIFVIQFIEGNFIQPLVMSKTMKLHPVTIIIGLLVFGYFFGIVGMIIATPLIATLKSIGVFFEKKYGWFQYSNAEK
ncbi:MAG: AI-2E family transporter [Bacilli bacterium]|nr:AI-2E family transporter [Bacilli bacterium]